MIKAALCLFLVTQGIHVMSAHANTPNTHCPRTDLGETATDCPWGGIARSLVEEATQAPGRKLGASLKGHAPEIDRAVREDAKRIEWKKLWGRSINFDELAKGEIVHERILQALNDAYGMPASIASAKTLRASYDQGLLGAPPAATDAAGHTLAHAGLEHTYGYLLSVLKTSFGYKRARWVQGEIEAGFGLKSGLLSPHTEQGTLLANVTYFMGRIAFRGDEGKLAILKKYEKAVPAELRSFAYDKLSPTRLEETVSAKDESGDTRKIVLRTDLVPFKTSSKSSHLLVYSIDDPSSGGARLITAFPVAAAFVETVVKPEGLGDGKPVQTRYNAFVQGVTDHKLTGTRKLAEAAKP